MLNMYIYFKQKLEKYIILELKLFIQNYDYIQIGTHLKNIFSNFKFYPNNVTENKFD